MNKLNRLNELKLLIDQLSTAVFSAGSNSGIDCEQSAVELRIKIDAILLKLAGE